MQLVTSINGLLFLQPEPQIFGHVDLTVGTIRLVAFCTDEHIVPQFEQCFLVIGLYRGYIGVI